MTDDEQAFLLFDGVCHLCVGSVQYVLKHEKKHTLNFASLQSEFGKLQRIKYQIPEKIDSLIYIHNGQALYYSDAAIKVAVYIGGLWRACIILKIIPKFIRDAIYRYIARNRYRWYGQKTSCWIPEEQWQHRFIE